MYRRVALGVIAAMTITSFISSHVNAAYSANDDFNEKNSQYTYDPTYSAAACSNNDTISAGVQASGLADLKDTPALKTIFQDLLNGGLTTTQAAAVMGNMYTESYDYINGVRFNPDMYEGGVNKPSSGYGLVQWTNDKSTNYTTGRRTNLYNYATAQGQPKSSADLQMKFLLTEYNATYKARLAGTAFDSGKNIADATTAWMRKFEVPAESGSDPAKLYSERIPAAKKIYGFYSTLGATTSDSTATATTDTCTGDGSSVSDSAVAGNILQTALGYAWPDPVDEGVNQKNQARPTYQTDKPKYAPGGLWSDCGAFVATVMRASGVDKNFPQLSVSKQGPYMETHPDLYKIIKNPSNNDVQPGDILVEYPSYDHIEIAKGGLTTVDASNFQRVPSVRPSGLTWLNTQGYYIARYIGAN